jgi:hypothetical protein
MSMKKFPTAWYKDIAESEGKAKNKIPEVVLGFRNKDIGLTIVGTATITTTAASRFGGRLLQ